MRKKPDSSEILYLAEVFGSMIVDENYKHSDINKDNIFDFKNDYRSHPRAIEKARPPRIPLSVFEELLRIEADAVIEVFTQKQSRDKYGIRERLSNLYVTNEEIGTLVEDKEKYWKNDPNFPDSIDVQKYRFAKAVALAKQRDREVQFSELSVKKDEKGLSRWYYGGVPFSGQAVIRLRKEFSGSDLLGKPPLLKTIDFKTGFKDGLEIEYRFTEENVDHKSNGYISTRFYTSKYWHFNVKEWKEGNIVSDRYFTKNGKERKKPLFRKLIGELKNE